ncbi:SixA phosphatase family protein [Shumkonia mesophila]|uniref:SixA phosphatase family protein n=1 Tax=Shumkonia mesophila TaxID=2838854 RepID=UPI002934C12F|nr:histidine phosphatase family protein [Shumkonia mesophila]
MKTIYLLRHAKSTAKDAPLADIDRPLSERGEADAKAMADYLAQAGIAPALVLCSSARRARDTLDGVLPGLGRKPVPILEDGLYHADASGLLRRLSEVDDAIPSVMLVGHNPAMEDLARKLADGGDPVALERLTAKFPTGALAVLETDAAAWRDIKSGRALLTAFVCPRDLD